MTRRVVVRGDVPIESAPEPVKVEVRCEWSDGSAVGQVLEAVDRVTERATLKVQAALFGEGS